MGVTDIEQAIARLGPGELAQLRRWFADFDAKAWEAEIQADAEHGRLDDVIAEAKADYAAGQAREL